MSMNTPPKARPKRTPQEIFDQCPVAVNGPEFRCAVHGDRYRTYRALVNHYDTTSLLESSIIAHVQARDSRGDKVVRLVSLLNYQDFVGRMKHTLLGYSCMEAATWKTMYRISRQTAKLVAPVRESEIA